MKLVFCAVIFAAVVAVNAIPDPEDGGVFPDYWQSDYDNFYDYPEESNEGEDNSKQNIEVKQEDTDKQVDAEIQDFREQNEEHIGADDDEKFDALEDYQFEDNRSDTDDKEQVKENNDDVFDEEPMPDDAPELLADNLAPSENKAPEENNKDENDSLDDDLWGDVVEEEVAPLPVPEDKKESIEEIQERVEEEIKNPDDQPVGKAVSEENPELAPILSDLDQIIEDTNELLLDNDLEAEDYDLNSDEDEKSFEDLFAENNDDDETPEEVLKDLDSDLDKLLETLDKLSDNDSNLGENDENADKNDDMNDVQDYEEKYNRPYKEGNILSLRDDYENVDDSNLADIFAEHADNKASDEDKLPNDEQSAEQDNVANDETNQSSNDENNNQASTTKTTEAPVEKAVAAEVNASDIDETFDYSDEINKLLSLNDNEDDDDKVDELIDKLLRHSYGNDGLIDDQLPKNEDAEMISTTEALATTDAKEAETSTTPAEDTRSTVMVDDLNSSEYNELMTQFAAAHSEDLDVNSDDFSKNVAPIHITLSVDTPTVITSPNYPSPYPVNNIVDWIIEGPGMGIEMNVTHFQVNGAIGDYLLVKPGGIDASGTDGLVFSFRLNSERRYRFTNVNRMFVRFETKPGMQFLNGFSFSARMIWPLPEIVREELPHPEAVLHPPRETLTLSLAGLTLPKFIYVKPVFRQLIAEMAYQYITDHGIEQGLNTTLEVTQITKTAVCNIRWPNYETCVEVTFGVPLHYEEQVEHHRLSAEDLDDMWRTYIVKDPFASELRELGITEYAIPNDRTVLMVWLVIALGVVISMAMLGFALWRFRCFEDYTRMMTYADTDSIQNEKKNMDLYPTPHQTLPPLYSDNDYKWADDKYDDSTRVDMGGFANKSYVRDDLFDFESDEDVITPRDRKSVISPRDVYEV